MLLEHASTLVSILCNVAVIIFVFIFTHYIWQRLTTTLPPGPTPWPVVGNSLILKWKSLEPYQYFQKVKHKYGNVMTFYFGPKPIVVLNDFESTREAFLHKQNDFAGRPWTLSGDIITEGHNDIALADFGPAWSVRRRLAMVALKKFADKNTVSHLACESSSDICQVMVEESSKNGRTVNIDQKLHLLLYNIIACVVFGKKYKPDDEDFKMLLRNNEQINEIFGSGLVADFIPILRIFPTPTTIRYRRLVEEIKEYAQKQIEEHKSTLDVENPRDITDAVLIARAEMERDKTEDIASFDDRQQRGILLDVFFAGTDTTAFTIHWAMLFALAYPELQERVYREIDANVGSRMLVPEDRHKLVYTEAFLLEVMRFRPIVPLSLLHTCTTTTQLYGYTIPKGTFVLSNIWECHHNAKYWPNPDKFTPERFINASTGKIIVKPDGFMAFGIGRRSCAGEHLARVDTFLIFATLIQKVKFSPADGDKEPDTSPGHGRGPFFSVPLSFDLKVESR